MENTRAGDTALSICYVIVLKPLMLGVYSKYFSTSCLVDSLFSNMPVIIFFNCPYVPVYEVFYIL